MSSRFPATSTSTPTAITGLATCRLLSRSAATQPRQTTSHWYMSPAIRTPELLGGGRAPTSGQLGEHGARVEIGSKSHQLVVGDRSVGERTQDGRRHEALAE